MINARHIAFGLSTVLGIRKRGWFIPYRYADDPNYSAAGAYPEIRTCFEGCAAQLGAVLDRIESHAAALTAIGGGPPPAPRFDQDWFPRLDAAAAYVLVRDCRPRRIVEVGSGHSTRFLARAVRDGSLDTELTVIDPKPRAAIDGLAVRARRDTLQAVGPAPFGGLQGGDMVFVDSSHILMPGSDVDIMLNRVLPTLPAGILVHFHDIFLPDAYPDHWLWRGYNEQQAVGALLAGGGYDLVFASHYVVTAMADRIEDTVLSRLPLLPGAYESSLWLRKRDADSAEAESAGV